MQRHLKGAMAVMAMKAAYLTFSISSIGTCVVRNTDMSWVQEDVEGAPSPGNCCKLLKAGQRR